MLCLSSNLTTIKNNKSANATQKILVSTIMLSIDPDFEVSDDNKISNLVHGKRNPSGYTIEKAQKLMKDSSRHPEYVSRFQEVLSLIDPNKMDSLKQELFQIILADDQIQGTTVVDIINRVDKNNLVKTENSLESSLAGILLYVLTATKHGTGKKSTTISQRLSDNLNAPETTSSAESQNNYSVIQEDAFRAAQDFCLKYENELALLPLCQIAFSIDPLHNNVRSIYTDFIRCPQKVREAILQIKEIPQFTFAKDWVDKAIDHYKSLVDQYELSTREFLYDGAKYLHRAYFNYSAVEVTNPNPFIFDPPCKLPERYFIKEYSTSAGCYIRDYLWYKQKDPSHNVKPPMDYLWDLCHLGNCDEPELTFWVCRFIISSSFQFRDDSWNVEAFWDSVHIDEEILKTQEDMYYYALLQLYLLTLNPDDLPKCEE